MACGSLRSGSHPGMWNAPKLALAAARRHRDPGERQNLGTGRLCPLHDSHGVQPQRFPGFETVSFLEPPYFGVTSYQNTAPLLQGVPQQTFSLPFTPANPLLPILGKGAGTNVGRGQNGALLWYDQNLKKAYNDRVNISFQRQMPGQIVVNASFFMNFGHQLYNKSLNVIDPQIQLKYQNSLNQSVAESVLSLPESRR